MAASGRLWRTQYRVSSSLLHLLVRLRFGQRPPQAVTCPRMTPLRRSIMWCPRILMKGCSIHPAWLVSPKHRQTPFHNSGTLRRRRPLQSGGVLMRRTVGGANFECHQRSKQDIAYMSLDSLGVPLASSGATCWSANALEDSDPKLIRSSSTTMGLRTT